MKSITYQSTLQCWSSKGITKHKTSLNKADYYLVLWNLELENVVLNSQNRRASSRLDRRPCMSLCKKFSDRQNLKLKIDDQALDQTPETEAEVLNRTCAWGGDGAVCCCTLINFSNCLSFFFNCFLRLRLDPVMSSTNVCKDATLAFKIAFSGLINRSSLTYSCNF